MLKSAPLAGPRRRFWILLAALLAVAVVGTGATHLFGAGSQRNGQAIPAAASEPGSTAPETYSDAAGTEAGSLLPGSSPKDSTLIGGQTNHLVFAGLIAKALFAYDSTTDFDARNDDLLLAAAPAPLGDPAALGNDLVQWTPYGPSLDSMKEVQTTVTVSFGNVSVSAWAAKKLTAIGAIPGTYGIDVSGNQTIATKSGAPVTVPVQLGVTVACPPASEFCALDRVFPQHLQDALGAG